VSIEHLLARVAALFRRVEALKAGDDRSEQLLQGSLTLDRDRMTAQWKGHAVPLTLTEFWVVHALALHPGHVRNRDQLMTAANVVLDDSTVTSQIKRIRAKFAAVDPEFSAIQTVYGMGYRWSVD
jgi:two-component system, OmpR family, response regulator